MKEINYWQQFLQSGKVADYLSYCRQNQSTKEEQEKSSGHIERHDGGYAGSRVEGFAGRREEHGGGCAGKRVNEGERFSAGFMQRYGNDIESGAFRGI